MLKGLDADVLKIIQEIIKDEKAENLKNAVIVVDDIKSLIYEKQKDPIEQTLMVLLIRYWGLLREKVWKAIQHSFGADLRRQCVF